MKTRKIICLLISISIFSSCTVEKRHYLGGYHIEWHKPHSNENKSCGTEFEKNELSSEIQVDKIQPTEIKTGLNSVIEIKSVGFPNSQQKTDFHKEFIQPIIKVQKLSASNYNIKPALKRDKEYIEKFWQHDNAKTDPLSIFSLVFVFVGLILALFTNAPIFIGFALPFLGFIFGIISICKITMHPIENKGLVLALIGILSSIVVLSIVLISFLLI